LDISGFGGFRIRIQVSTAPAVSTDPGCSLQDREFGSVPLVLFSCIHVHVHCYQPRIRKIRTGWTTRPKNQKPQRLVHPLIRFDHPSSILTGPPSPHDLICRTTPNNHTSQISRPCSTLSRKRRGKPRKITRLFAALKNPMSPPPSPPPGQADPEKGPVTTTTGTSPPPYTAFSPWRRRFILTIITVAGFFGPLAGGIYLPALPVLEHEFQASATAINITVSVFMLTFAFAVSTQPEPCPRRCL
jgi:hypothetical protein